ncbi:diaminopimelate decarboxylase [uncultured Roseobacter sp.]|uniref:diaminopimelate decarboxylase n=1 Tax=uncultured Roseobacter sp. TaxID=114847 RepID=UPI0026337317|nr:diaminopimelate decarboxylase [uncultured Roseobacter sp.]
MASVSDNEFYRNDELIRELAEQYNTPLYVFDEKNIRDRCKELRSAIEYENLQIRYACKALTLQAVLKVVLDEGLWIDASSINEVDRALRAGFSPSQIYYTGEGATLTVYQNLTKRGILINCTSIDQIKLLGQASGAECSIRLNPGEGHGANTKTNTGGPSSKHGIYFDQISDALEIASSNGVRIVGLHSHIGSGTDLSHWLRIKDKTLNIARELPDVHTINLGGGLPVVYDPEEDQPMPLRQWGAALSDSMRAFSKEMGRDFRLQIEPGRYIVAASGVLLAEAQAVKETSGDNTSPGYEYVIVNSGLNHNIRPSMYGSYHPIRFLAPQTRQQQDRTKSYVVAGYLCESGDVFTVDEDGTLLTRELPQVEVGDIMVMAGVGAYSHSMKSEYNSMNLPMSILIQANGQPKVIERRGTLHDIMRREVEAYNEGVDE